MALALSGNLSLGTNLYGADRCIKYEVDGAYGAYGLVEANTDTSVGLDMSDYYGYDNDPIPAIPVKVSTTMNFIIRTTWTDTSSIETGFRIQWSINGGAYTWTTTVGANIETVNFPSSCSNGSTYRGRVQSYTATKNSAYQAGGTATGDGVCQF